jgi:hypothetical protein
VQDALAITVAVLTGAWLVWSLTGRLARPSCGLPPSTPAGSDGFVPLDDLERKAKRSGRHETS